jgi:uncharacterized protein YceH (UPF0502 family)
MNDSHTGLAPNEIRVLGALVEKDATTPEYYPLSLNALVNACNQKSNRDPIMSLDESSVRDALEGLHERGLAGPASGADSRVTKYEHRIYEALKLSRPEVAVLCELLLRGPQTPGELRGRAERMYRFESIEDVLATLRRLIDREPALVQMLPRQPGTKESRYAHLLGSEITGLMESRSTEVEERESPSRIEKLETRVDQLQAELEKLRQDLAEVHKRLV